MSLRIVVVPINHGAGVTTACLGLAHALDRQRVSVGYIKPFGRAAADGEDPSAELFRLATPLRPAPPIPFTHVEAMLAAGRDDELMEEVLALAADTIGAHKVTIVEGVARELRSAHSTRLNVEIARSLDAEVLFVASAADTNPERLVHQVSAMAQGYRVPGDERVIGIVLNHIPLGQDDGRYERALEEAGYRTVCSLVHRPEFARPRVRDIVHQLGFEVLNAGDDRRRIAGAIVAAQSLPGFLAHLDDERLVIVPGDRHEVLLSAALAEQSGTRLAAVLLTAGIRPDADVMRLCRPALQEGLPILLTDDLTFEATSRVVSLDPGIPADDEDRARLVMRGAADAFDDAWLAEVPNRSCVRRLTPAGFRLAMATSVAKGDLRIGLTDGDTPRVVRAALSLHERGLLRCMLVGDPERVEAIVTQSGSTVPPGLRVIDPGAVEPAEARRLEQVAREAGTRSSTTADLAPTDSLVVGLDLLARGEIDGLVTGLSHDHHDVVALAEAVIGHQEEIPLLTSVHVLNLPHEVVIFTDCFLNEHPSSEELALIALSGVAAAESIGMEARVALVTGPRSDPDASQRIAGAVQAIRDRRPDLQVEGPVTLDRASRRVKAGEGVGNASVFAFADLATAESSLTAVSRDADVSTYGPAIIGLRRPVNVLAPTASALEIADMVVGTAHQAGEAG